MQKQKNDFLPKISVVIPSFNKAKYIGITLKSIFSQGYKNLEVIVQDGGSTDGSVDTIKKYAKEYPIIWETKKDNGQLDAVNKGFQKATGDIFTFINADDYYEKEIFYDISTAYLSNSDKLWFAGRGIVVNERGKEIARLVTIYKNYLLSMSNYNLLLANNYLMQPSVFFTKEAYKKYGPFTGTNDFITEYDFWLKLGKISMPGIINKTISKFRIEPTTKTKRMFNSLLKEDRKIVIKYTNNLLILIFHDLNNWGRVLIGRFV